MITTDPVVDRGPRRHAGRRCAVADVWSVVPGERNLHRVLQVLLGGATRVCVPFVPSR